jgi:hypothetical protein
MGVMAIRGRLQRMGETPLEAAAIHGRKAQELGDGVLLVTQTWRRGVFGQTVSYIFAQSQPTPHDCSVTSTFVAGSLSSNL